MELPKRKPTRLQEYDYSTPGMYFLTVCVKDKKHLLGKIIIDNGAAEPRMVLSEYGYVLEKHLKRMNEKYSHMHIDKYVIMPNHFHLILHITDYATDANGLSASAKPYNSETAKFVSLLKRYCNQEYGKNIWQSSCYDHIIRNERDYKKIWEYIDTNVIRWNQDSLYN